jgi:hypothetical protein
MLFSKRCDPRVCVQVYTPRRGAVVPCDQVVFSTPGEVILVSTLLVYLL